MGANVGHGANEQTDPSANDEAARSRRFQALALPHLDAAYNLARWLSHNPRDAEDIAQEAYLRALRFFDTFRGDSARPWLLAIVRRVWYDEWRRRSTSEEVTPFDELRDDTPPDGWETASADPETLAMRAEDARGVHDALQRLPVEYREVLVLREMEDLSYREIAVIVDVPVGTVMSRLARGRRRLAMLLTVQHQQGRTDCDVQHTKRNSAGNGESSQPGRPSVRGAGGRGREEPAVDGGPLPHTDGPIRGSIGEQIGGHTREAPDEL